MTPPLEILLIEDNEGDVEMTQHAVDDGNACHISVANDGLEALDFLHKRGGFAGVPTPQLILLDLNMPSGFAVPDPSLVDTAAVAKELPYGTITITAVKGGLEIPAETGGDSILIANAAVIVSLDDGK